MKKYFWPILIFIIFFSIYLFTSSGKTPYDYFTRLAASFLQGKYYITENPPWLSELVPAGENKFYVIQPPMPALLLLPFVFVFGKDFPQQILAHLLGAGIVILTMSLSYKIKKDSKLALLSGLTIGLGSIVWFLASTGSVWYLSQITACFFLTAALVESLDKKRLWIVGALLGAAYLSRIHTILSLPLFLFLNRQKIKNILNLFPMGFGFLPFFLFNSIYNFMRFGTIFDKGYFLIPGILSEPWFSKGMLNVLYIPEHLKIIFLKLPNFLPTFPFIQPSWYGLAIWITTPVFIFAFMAHLKSNRTKMLWFTILLILLLVTLRGGTGWTQFGYRYAVDFYPFLMLLTIEGVSYSKKLKWFHWLLLIIGIIVNLWGVLWINKFGWVSF